MEITTILAAVAVSDRERARAWYSTLFGREPDAEPMQHLDEWRSSAGTVQVVQDPERAGGSLLTLSVPDAATALHELAARGGPQVDLDEVTSDKVRFASFPDPDGNLITVVEQRPGATL